MSCSRTQHGTSGEDRTHNPTKLDQYMQQTKKQTIVSGQRVKSSGANNDGKGSPLVKSANQKIIFLISHPKHMLWVLKRTVSMRQFF